MQMLILCLDKKFVLIMEKAISVNGSSLLTRKQRSSGKNLDTKGRKNKGRYPKFNRKRIYFLITRKMRFSSTDDENLIKKLMFVNFI